MESRRAPFSGCTARLVWHERFLAYDFGPHHPLRPERLWRGLDLLRAAGLWQPESETLRPSPASAADLERVHSRSYLAAVEALDRGEPLEPGLILRYGLGPGDNPSFPGMHEASALIAGGTLDAARAIMRGDVLHAFNPAGGLHHALRERASGFCIYNDPAVAIAALLAEEQARVLYLDFDAHHGDGVQLLFYDDPRVLTFSIHESGRYLFPGTGDVEELGEGDGWGYSVNAPMEPFTQDDAWLAAVSSLVPPLAERFRPDIIVSQHGCDGHAWDPLTHLGLTTRAIARQAELVHELAHRYCAGRWIATGGGGYDYRRVVPRMHALVFAQMVGQPLPEELPLSWRERWGADRGPALPERYLDDPSAFPPAPRAAEIAHQNAQTVGRAREAALPPLLRHAFPPAPPNGNATKAADPRPRTGDARSEVMDTPRGRIHLVDGASASLIQQLRPDPGLSSFAHAAEQEHAWLERVAGHPLRRVALAHTEDGRIVAWATLAPGEAWLAALPFVREVAIEVSRGWRGLGIGTQLLRFLCAAPDLEELVLVGIGLSWFWDTQHERLDPAAYRGIVLNIFRRAGFEERRPNQPHMRLQPASVLVARIGSRVEPEQREAFEHALRQRPALT